MRLGPAGTRYVKRPVRDESYPTPDYGIERLDITAGPQLMDGATALRFARSRHDTNDYSRAQRQQLVLSALRTRMAEGGFLRGLPGLIDRVGSVVQTNFDPANIPPLAQFGTGINGDAIKSEVLYPCGGAYPLRASVIDEYGPRLHPPARSREDP